MSYKELIYLSPLFDVDKEEPRVFCKRCGRLHRGASSKEIGYGPQCYRIQKLERNQQITLFSIDAAGDADEENRE